MTAFRYDFVNPSTTDTVNIDDMGISIAPEASRGLLEFDITTLSTSIDLNRALLDRVLIIKDTVNGYELDSITAMRQLLTGGHKVTKDGIARVHASPRPLYQWTYFTGAGDKLLGISETGEEEWGIGEGDLIIFKMSSKDDSKSVDLVFSEDINIKDGFIITEDAPFGSTITFSIVHPISGAVLNRFGNKIPLLKSGWFPLDTADSGYMPKGLILRITVHNSSGDLDTPGMQSQDPPANFRLTGRIEMYRKYTYTGGIISDV